MENKINHSIGTVSKSYIKIVNTVAWYKSLIESVGVKLTLSAQSFSELWYCSNLQDWFVAWSEAIDIYSKDKKNNIERK
jgi:hypothetical protein